MTLLGREAVAQVLEAFGPEACVVCANGYVSREVHALGDRPSHFYMLGSMGLAASIALGCALARPERRVVVLDGDGNVLMGLDALALIGAQRPPNLFHVVLDNGVYAATGNQPSIAAGVSLQGIARAAGYRTSLEVADAAALAAALTGFGDAPAPAFLRVRIAREEHPRDFPRVAPTPLELRDRFAAALRGTA